MTFWRQRLFALTLVSLSLSACGGAGTDAPPTDAAGVEPPTVLVGEELQQYSPTEPIELETTPTIPAPIAEPTPLPEPQPAPAQVQLSGQITYDRVQFAERYYQGLDYEHVLVLPARGVLIQLLDENGATLATTQTDSGGEYRFTISADTQTRIRVAAQLLATSAWDIQVRDNTAGDALYVLDGALASSGSNSTQTRNLHAPSGWSQGQYTGDRSAAPFAILDSLYDAVQLVREAAAEVALPPLTVYWSTRNIAISGSLSEGHIGTSFFTSNGPSIYLLGAADNDSDEYDRAVIQHEFGHYLEHQIGRTESIGGSHSQTSRLDMRVAFGEAWGNAFAGMASGDPLYRDSLGPSQSQGFTINVEARSSRNQGWYSEASIQAILYDLFDANNDAGDDLELGFMPIFDVLKSRAYRDFDGMASIYPFIGQLKAMQPIHSNNIDAMMEDYSIYGKGWYGEGETNDGGASMVLPLYHRVNIGQTVNLCSDSQFQDSNGLDVRRFIHIELPTTRSYDIRAHKTVGLARANPQFKIFKQGRQVDSVLNGTADREDAVRYLNAGQYVFEVYEQSNADGNDSNGGLACFDVTIE